MKNIYINGKFMCQAITGVQRYAIEIVKHLDKVKQSDIKFTIISPSKEFVLNELHLNNIDIIYLKGKPNYYWEQIKLARFCKKNKPDDLLNLCNVAPIMYPGSCVIHDIAVIDAPYGFSKKQIMIYKYINKKNVHRYNKIFTVSNIMKKRIEEFYRIENVKVTYNSAEHINEVLEQKPKCDLPNDFYFTLGSFNPNKNFKAIVNLAKKNPDKNFVISGKKHKSFANEELEKLENVIFTGYVDDCELVYLYRHCQAFLFPSNYEGFGIPPLEAIVSGCKKIVCNDIPVLRELYNGYCSFIKFNEVDYIDVNKINEVCIDGISEKFSWKESANIICNEFK